MNTINKIRNSSEPTDSHFQWKTDQFGEFRIMQFQIPGFELLDLKQKKLLYYLSQAALCGRDILWDQNFKYNLIIRKTLEAIITNFKGDRSTDDWNRFITYCKTVFFANGIHHHYSNDKFIPEFNENYFTEIIQHCPEDKLNLQPGESIHDRINLLIPILFDPNKFAIKINQANSVDMIKTSAINYYQGLTQEEVESYNSQHIDPQDEKPISHGLNSQLIKKNNKIIERRYCVDGLYGEAISEIIKWLKKASEVAETPYQQKEIELLITFYETGDLHLWDEYNIKWVQDTEPLIDYVNGFIENYNDPMGMKASWESLINFKNIEATKRTEIISKNAQWFEDHSPISDIFKKKEVKGVTAKVITAVQLGGDCYPSTPIGVNLPNADWIRKEYGSKSVTIENITYAYDQASKGNGFLEEFAASQEEIDRDRKYGFLTDNIHTDLHECLGHGSGQLLPGTDPGALKNHGSPLEEARADLFALYYLADDNMLKLGILPDKDAYKAEYDSYIRNGILTQLIRIQPNKKIEQAHMRCRALVAQWAYANGMKNDVISLYTSNNKTFIKINDYRKLRELFGELLAEIQRIKSEGDYEAGKNLVEKYAINIDADLHQEILARYKTLNLAPYGGFINPTLSAVTNTAGDIIDVNVKYSEDYLDQMIRYGKDYSFLPVIN